MARITIGVGVLLIVLGLVAYFATGGASVTALIPAFFGVPLAVLGFVALTPRWRAVAMHVAVVIALLGLVGAVFRPIKAVATGGELIWAAPLITQLVMAVLCLIFVILCVRSFIAARGARA